MTMGVSSMAAMYSHYIVTGQGIGRVLIVLITEWPAKGRGLNSEIGIRVF